nr:aldehyde dehydrogenase family protein [Gluconobacter sp. P1C6_b]
MGAYANIFLDNDQSAELIKDDRIRGVTLTGSERADRAIAAQTGAALKKDTMELANDPPYGLGGAVFSRNIRRAEKVAEQVETDMGFINTATAAAPELPFGRIKNSGFGRELSFLGLEEFINRKLVRIR